jgi:prolipoprotein diacylglyceryl transferase
MIHEFLYINWDVSPDIFSLRWFSFRWYSLMFVLAFALGWYVIYKKMMIRDKKPLILWENVLVPVFLGTLLGARLGHCFFYQPQDYFPQIWKIFIPFSNGKFVGYQGLASHGAAVGILLGLYYYSWKNKLSYLWVLDRVVITIALSGFFIRMGNLMNSEIYGHETSLPWGFVFLRANETVPKHPTQIYEALSYLAIFIFLYLLYLKKRPPFRDGVIFSLFLILLFSARFFIEFVKEVQVNFEKNLTLDMGQWLSIPLIVAGFVLFAFLFKKGLVVEPEPEPVPVPVVEIKPENRPVAKNRNKSGGKNRHKSGHKPR